MVRGPFLPPRFNVDIAGFAALRHGPRGQDQVDPQAHLAPEHVQPVIPPAENALFLFEQTKSVLQAEVQDALQRVPFDGAAELGAREDLDVLDLEEQLQLLATLNERQARTAECRLFAGMAIAEIAEALGVSARTVDDDWAMARAWLSARLGGAT